MLSLAAELGFKPGYRDPEIPIAPHLSTVVLIRNAVARWQRPDVLVHLNPLNSLSVYSNPWENSSSTHRSLGIDRS